MGETQFLQQARQYQGLSRNGRWTGKEGATANDNPNGLVCQKIFYLLKIVFNYLCLLRAITVAVAALHTAFLDNPGVSLYIVGT
jgi:hypothetical protein